jgi:hypothetical protein
MKQTYIRAKNEHVNAKQTAKWTLFCQIEKKVVESGQKRRVGRGAPNTHIFLPNYMCMFYRPNV